MEKMFNKGASQQGLPTLLHRYLKKIIDQRFLYSCTQEIKHTCIHLYFPRHNDKCLVFVWFEYMILKKPQKSPLKILSLKSVYLS